ncbi:gamma-glutamylcyclotransferase [Dietzia sp. NPDC055340]
MPEQLFVYGTLAPGRPNAHVLADVPGARRPATISGSLYDRGRPGNAKSVPHTSLSGDACGTLSAMTGPASSRWVSVGRISAGLPCDSRIGPCARRRTPG